MVTHAFGPPEQLWVQPRPPVCSWHANMPAGQAPPSGAGSQGGGVPQKLHGRTQTWSARHVSGPQYTVVRRGPHGSRASSCTPAILRWQSLSYVLPSQPHTGLSLGGQLVGLGAQVPVQVPHMPSSRVSQ